MAWRPLVVGDRRAALTAIVRDIVAGVDESAATTVGEHVDRAILHTYVAREEIAPDPEDRGGTALGSAVAELLRSPTRPALFGGAAGLGFCVAHLAGDETAELVCRRVDEVLLRMLTDWHGPYDLIEGLVGLGVYALTRGEPGHPLAVRVREELSRRARSHGEGLAWHTPPGGQRRRMQQPAALGEDQRWSVRLRLREQRQGAGEVAQRVAAAEASITFERQRTGKRVSGARNELGASISTVWPERNLSRGVPHGVVGPFPMGAVPGRGAVPGGGPFPRRRAEGA